ncbi:MAG: hypothetical protein ACREVK_10980 [Gammaproteobacteria bacterium]
MENEMLRAENAELKIQLAQRNTTFRAEFATQLPRLIQLCHPDKHGNSYISNQVAKWLILQKEVL